MKMGFLLLGIVCWIVGTVCIGLGMLIALISIIESEY